MTEDRKAWIYYMLLKMDWWTRNLAPVNRCRVTPSLPDNSNPTRAIGRVR